VLCRDRDDPAAWIAECVVLAASSAALAVVAAASARTLWWAPSLAAASFAGLSVWFGDDFWRWDARFDDARRMLVVSGGAAPLVAWAAARVPPRPVAAAGVLLYLLFAGPWLLWTRDSWAPEGVLVAALVPVLLVFAARTELSVVRLVGVAALLGLAARALLPLGSGDRTTDFGAWSWFELPAAFIVATLFALPARRALSMTVVPSDSPDGAA
jgi:hypothetical protein